MDARRAARRVLSLAPVLWLVARREPGPEGLSAIVRVRGDEEWLEPSLLSIRDFADEILVLDNGALEMLPIVRSRWRLLVPAAERVLPRVGGARFAYHVLLRCRPAGPSARP